MAGSLLMLASIVVFGLSQGTFSLVDSGTSANEWVFLGFLVAFAVKAPIFPFHGWLVDAYRESPPEVAAILSGVVSKAAVYGLLRIVIAKFPEPVDDFQARSSRSRRSGSSTARCSRSARPTSAPSPRTRRWRRWA